MKRYKLTLRAKLTASFFLIGVIPLLVAGRVIQVVVSDDYISRIREESEAVVERTGIAVEEAVEQYIALAVEIAVDRDVVNAMVTESRDAAYTRRVHQQLSGYLQEAASGVQIHVLGINGAKYSTGQPPNIYNLQAYGDYGIFRRAAQNPYSAALYSNYYTGSGGVKYPLTVIKPFFSGTGAVAGYVLLDIPRQVLLELLEEQQPDYTGRVALYTAEGMSVVDTAVAGAEGLLSPAAQSWLAGAEGFQAVQEGQGMQISTHLESLDLFLTAHYSTAEAVLLQERIKALVYAIVAGTAVLAGLLSLGLTHTVLLPMNKLLGVIDQAGENGLQERFPVSERYGPEFVALGNSYNGMLDRIHNLIENVVEKQRRLNIAETQSLTAQIKPHFYYNFLNDVKSLAKMGRNEDIVRMVMAFGTLLRANMSREQDVVTVGEEIHFLESYLEIHSIRMDYQVEISVSVEEEIRGCTIPKLLLQPLVENAVIHGMDGARKGKIQIRAYAKGQKLVFEIEDNGPGIADPGGLLDGEGRGVGLRNVDRRLKLHFGEEWGLNIESEPGLFTRVTATMRRQD